jgi:hypothetical protein
VRLVSWSCSQNFESNLNHLLDLAVDVTVVCECAGHVANLGNGALTWGIKPPVAGAPKHFGVLARKPWTVEPSPTLPGELPWLVGAEIAGPARLTSLAVWPVRLSD